MYRNADGSERRELRLPEEVFKADSLATLAMVPITLGHPVEGGTHIAVTGANASKYSVGAIGDTVKQDGRYVTAPFKIHADAAISAVENGTRELSCAYDCRLEWTPGVYNGERYDAIQRDIVSNHVAIVARGRAGAEMRIDSADVDHVDENATQRNEVMTIKFRIDGVDHEVSETAAQALAVRDARVTQALAASDKARDEAIARADAADAEIVKLKADLEPAKIQAKIAARVDLVTKATAVMGADFKADGLTDVEIKRAVIVKLTPTAKLDDKSADYVSARFDHALEAHEATKGDDAKKTETAKASAGDVRAAVVAATNADAADSAETSRKKMIERNRKLWESKPAA